MDRGLRPPFLLSPAEPTLSRFIPLEGSNMISESPVVTVHIPPLLRRFAGGNEEVTASGDTVGEVLEAVSNEYHGFRGHVLLADGTLAPGFAVYLGPTSIRDLQGMATPVQMEELVSIVLIGDD